MTKKMEQSDFSKSMRLSDSAYKKLEDLKHKHRCRSFPATIDTVYDNEFRFPEVVKEYRANIALAGNIINKLLNGKETELSQDEKEYIKPWLPTKVIDNQDD